MSTKIIKVKSMFTDNISLIIIKLCVNVKRRANAKYSVTVGKSWESRKLLPWKFDNVEDNFDFAHKEMVGNVTILFGN